MGNTLAPGAPPFTKDVLRQYLLECKDYEVISDDSCADSCGRIFRTVPCLSVKENHAKVALKVYHKREHPFLPNDVKYDAYKERLQMCNQVIASLSLPSVLPWQLFKDTPQHAIFVRQYIHDTLLHRIEAPPEMTNVECKWILYQILHCLAQLHDVGVCHGGLQPSNLLLTAWNWVMITDIPFWKPATVPASFTRPYRLFYAREGRDECYLAPERFVDTDAEVACPRHPADGSGPLPRAPASHSTSPFCRHSAYPLPDAIADILQPGPDAPALAGLLARAPPATHTQTLLGGADGGIAPPHDIFSVGAVFAHLLSGRAPFTHEQALLYRAGAFAPDLLALPPAERVVCAHMLQRDPARRLSARGYLRVLTRAGFFPPGFVAAHQFFGGLVAQDGRGGPDAQASLAKRLLPKLMARMSSLDNAAASPAAAPAAAPAAPLASLSLSQLPDGTLTPQHADEPTAAPAAALLAAAAAVCAPSSAAHAILHEHAHAAAPVPPAAPASVEWLLRASYAVEDAAAEDLLPALRAALAAARTQAQYRYDDAPTADQLTDPAPAPASPAPAPATPPAASASPSLPLLVPLLTSLLRAVSSPLLLMLCLDGLGALAPLVPDHTRAARILPHLMALLVTPATRPPLSLQAAQPAPKSAAPRRTTTLALAADAPPAHAAQVSLLHSQVQVHAAYDEHASPMVPVPLSAAAVASALRALAAVAALTAATDDLHAGVITAHILPALHALYSAPQQTLLVRAAVVEALPALAAAHARWADAAHRRGRELALDLDAAQARWAARGLADALALADPAAALAASDPDATADPVLPGSPEAAALRQDQQRFAALLAHPRPLAARLAGLLERRQAAAAELSARLTPLLLTVLDTHHTTTTTALLVALPALLPHFTRRQLASDLLPHLLAVLPNSYAAVRALRAVPIGRRGARKLSAPPGQRPAPSPDAPSPGAGPAVTAIAHSPLLTHPTALSAAALAPAEAHWLLRVHLALALHPLAAAAGPRAFTDFFTPAFAALLVDPSPAVLQAALHAFLLCAASGLCNPDAALALAPRFLPLLLAPTHAIRTAAVAAVAAAAQTLGVARTATLLMPQLAPFLRLDVDLLADAPPPAALPGVPVSPTRSRLFLITADTLAAALRPPLSAEAFEKLLSGVTLSLLDVVHATRPFAPVDRRALDPALADHRHRRMRAQDEDALSALPAGSPAATTYTTEQDASSDTASAAPSLDDAAGLFIVLAPADLRLHAAFAAFSAAMHAAAFPLLLDRPTIAYPAHVLDADAAIDAYTPFCIPRCGAACKCPAYTAVPHAALAALLPALGRPALASPTARAPAPVIDMGVLLSAADAPRSAGGHFPSLLLALLSVSNHPSVARLVPYLYAEVLFPHMPLYGIRSAAAPPADAGAPASAVDTLSVLAEVGVGMGDEPARPPPLTHHHSVAPASPAPPGLSGASSLSSSPLVASVSTQGMLALANSELPDVFAALTSELAAPAPDNTLADFLADAPLPAPTPAPLPAPAPTVSAALSRLPARMQDVPAALVLQVCQWLLWACATGQGVLGLRDSALQSATHMLIAKHPKLRALLFKHRYEDRQAAGASLPTPASDPAPPFRTLQCSSPVLILPPSAWPEHTSRALLLPPATTTITEPARSPRPTLVFPFPALIPTLISSSPLFAPSAPATLARVPLISPKAPSSWPYGCDYDPVRHALLLHDGPCALAKPASAAGLGVRGSSHTSLSSLTRAPSAADPAFGSVNDRSHPSSLSGHSSSAPQASSSLSASPGASSLASPQPQEAPIPASSSTGTSPVPRPRVSVLAAAEHASNAALAPPGTASIPRHAAHTWLPRGVCASDLVGHRAPILDLCVAADNQFVATSSEDGCLRLFSSRGLVDHAACAADVTLQLADEAVTAVCALDRDHGLVAGTARGEAVVLDVGRLSAGNSHLSTTFDGTFVSGDAGTSPAYATLEPAAAASRLADEAVLHRLTVPGAVVNAHHAQSVAHSLVMLAAHDGNTYGYDLRAGAPVFSLPAVGGLGVAQPASGPFRGDVGALTASCMGPSQFSFLTGSQHGFVSTYDLRYAVPVSLWRTASATAVTALHAVNSTTLFPLTRGGNIVHSAANPLVVVSSEYCNEVAAYDVASGLCRSILRATDPYRRVHPPAAPDRPGATAVEDLLGPRNYSRYHSVNGGLDYSGYYTVPFHRPNPAHYGLGYPMALVSCHDLLLQSYAPTPQQLFAGTTSLNYHLPTAPLPPSSLVQPASLSSFAYLPGAAVITAGSDRSLRYWNLREPHKSYRVSSATEARRLRYTSHSVTTEWENGELTAMVAVQEHEEPSPAAGHGGGATCHSQAIRRLAVVEHPQSMLVTAGGTEAKVWI